MRFAVNIPPFTDARTIVDLAADAEAAGWDGVFVWDHMQFIKALQLPIHDPWGLLSAMAVRTERVVLGTAVTPVARRRLQVLARQVMTLDHLSSGRALLGVGIGDPPDADFEVFGDPPSVAVRAAMLDEALPVLDVLLRGEAVSHHGEHYDIDAHLHPGSVQSPRVPIIVAGVAPNPHAIRRAQRFEGFFPISLSELLTPQGVADYLGDAPRADGWEVYAARTPGFSADEFAAAGVTWLVEGGWPEGDWVPELRGRIKAGPA